MSFSFVPLTRQQEWPCLYEIDEEAPLLVSVDLREPGLGLLRCQVDRDINMKGRGWNPIGFSLLELLDIERLLSRHPDQELVQAGDNLLLTHAQRFLLASYTNRYLQRAIEMEDSLQSQAYADAFDALLQQSTMLIQPSFPFMLSGYDYGVSALTRPLALLWAFVGRYQNDGQYDTVAPVN